MKMTGENPINLKHNEWVLTIKDIQDAGRDRTIIFEKIPQRESQKIKHIIRFMSVLEKYGSQNTTQIKNKSGLSWNSVTRTLKLLEEKKIVWTIQRDDKKNNEKIHSLDRKSAIRYYVSLLTWKTRNKFEIKRSFISKKIMNQIISTIPEELAELIDKTSLHDFKLNKNVQKKLFNAIFMKKSLLYYYVKGFYCRKCFLEKNVVEVVRVEDSTICPRCGHVDSYNEEVSITPDKTIRYRKNMVDQDVKKKLESHNP